MVELLVIVIPIQLPLSVLPCTQSRCNTLWSRFLTRSLSLALPGKQMRRKAVVKAAGDAKVKKVQAILDKVEKAA